MPSVLKSDDLADLAIAIDRCDERIGAAIAVALAHGGAQVRLRGKDRDALQDLQRKMAAQWLRAELDAEPTMAEAAIRVFGSAADAADFIGSSAPGRATREILVVSGEASRSDYATLQEMLRDQRDGQMHAMLLDEADDSFAALVALLLSPAGGAVPNQCFALSARGVNAQAAAPAYPPMPVCMPAPA